MILLKTNRRKKHQPKIIVHHNHEAEKDIRGHEVEFESKNHEVKVQ
jgi:hypothetical protein